MGVGLTTGNMIAGFVGTAFIASPINCGAIAMVLSLIIVPVVSLFTKRVEFEVDPPHVEGAIAREYEQELEAVSYTHLDVYKRQASCMRTRSTSMRRWRP